MKTSWILAFAAGVILALLAIYPQINLKNIRGDDWQGVFASCDLDEMAYASYLQALIDGRPRRSDPYTGRDDSPSDPQPESLFSIQFVPAYLVAIPARVFGLSAVQAMPYVSAFAAFFTALALFWLIVSITEDEYIAFAGTLIVIVGSALVIGIGAINGFYENGVAYPFFPFLRRYIPSVAFPFLFAFFACLWNGLKTENRNAKMIYSAAASVLFALLVFSYFYVWTAAAAILGGLTLCVMIFRTEHRRRDLTFLFITGAFSLLALVPYAMLLANRDETMDKAQLLVFTRRPDLLRSVEIIGYLVLTATALALWRKHAHLADRKAFMIGAFALSPLLVLNQQVLTARSLQPFHYEFYVINYVVLLAIVLIAAIFWRKFLFGRNRLSFILLTLISTVAIFWGYIEARETSAFWDSANVQRDEAMPVNLHLRALANDNFAAAKQQITLNLDPLQADGQPTVAPQSPLWARHQHVFAGLESWEENKLRYYQLLYYSDLDANWLRRSLIGCRNIEACMALFGWDRFNARLSANAKSLTLPEIDAEVAEYAAFYRDFDREDAEKFPLSHVIIYSEMNSTLENLDRWYERSEVKTFGKYQIYQLNLTKTE